MPSLPAIGTISQVVDRETPTRLRTTEVVKAPAMTTCRRHTADFHSRNCHPWRPKDLRHGPKPSQRSFLRLDSIAR